MGIRRATDADRATIAAIQTASWRTAYATVLAKSYLESGLGPDVAAHWLKGPIPERDVVLLAEEPEPCGFIAVRDGPTPYIDNLHVLPGERSRGIGRRLMQGAAEALRGQGRDSAYLWVVADNLGALRFYLRLGGQAGERAQRDLFGTPVEAIRIDWPDLRRMRDAA